MKRLLMTGLPGSGKTTLSMQLKERLESVVVPMLDIPVVQWVNANQVRELYTDWDFSIQGRIRQSKRMYRESRKKETSIVIFDTISPTDDCRQNLRPSWIVWVDTVKSSEFDDTDEVFVPPKKYDLRVSDYNFKKWVDIITLMILNKNCKQI